MTRDAIIELLRAHRPRLEAAGASHVALFGSVARNEDTPDSDLDVIVDAATGEALGFFALTRIRDEIRAITGRPVDILSAAGVWSSERFRARVGPDVLTVY